MCSREPWACRNNPFIEGGLGPRGGGTAIATSVGVAIGETLTDEKENPIVIKQVTPTSCGSACAEMMLRDRGILISQMELGTELNSMRSLANKLNKADVTR